MTKFLTAVAAILLSAPSLWADDQNGLSVNVSRKVISRVADSASTGSRVRQGMKVEIKNQRIKEMPVGELQWTVVMRRPYSGLEKQRGKLVLKALKPAETVELAFSNFMLTRDYPSTPKDKFEYEVIIRHEDKETYRFSTASDFAFLVKEATLIEPATDEQLEKSRQRIADFEKPVAEQKLEADPGKLTVNLSRKTLETHGPEQSSYYSGMITRRKQSLKLDMKNIGIKPLPAGEIRWTVLVKGIYSGFTRYEGVEPLKPIRSAEASAAQVGNFIVLSRKTTYDISKGDIEYRVVVVHDGKETYRYASVADFAMLVKASTPAEKEEDAAPVVVVKPTVKPVAEPEKKPVAPVAPIAMPTTPATPATPAVPPKPPVVPEPVVERPPVDFFNLGGK